MKKEITTVCVLFVLIAAAAYGQTAQTRLDNGKRLFDQGNYTAAIQELTEAIRLDPNMAEAYAYRSRAHGGNNNNDQALADANRAIQLNPRLGMGYFARGNRQSDNDRKIADFNEAIRLDPNFAMAYNNRGFAYYNKRDYDRAIADYTQAIRLDPNFAMAYSNRGFAYNEKKDYDRAIADYTEAIRLEPTTARYRTRGVFYYSRCNIHASRGDLNRTLADVDMAIADWEASLRLDPNQPSIIQDLPNVKNFRTQVAERQRQNDQAAQQFVENQFRSQMEESNAGSLYRVTFTFTIVQFGRTVEQRQFFDVRAQSQGEARRNAESELYRRYPNANDVRVVGNTMF